MIAKLYETITAENWIKGHFTGTKPGTGCLYWHVLDAGVAVDAVRDAIFALFAERLLPLGKRPSAYHGIGDFNDHPKTIVEDVLRVCKLADV